MKNNATFVEVDFVQKSKYGQSVYGDVFASKRLADEDRIVCVLADGLGSGIKANVLATLTSTMAMKYVSSEMDLREASEIIMATLPVCSKRQIGYSTFTIVDIRPDGQVKIIEYDNPSYTLLRGYRQDAVEKKIFKIETATTGVRELAYSSFKAGEHDRLVIYSDGVSQSGMGTSNMPLGWTQEAAGDFVEGVCRKNINISARDLAKEVVEKAWKNDDHKAKDDITCAVINFRRPRKLLVVTGPPYNEKNDSWLAGIVKDFQGKKVIAGGTTATIIARELNREVEIDLSGSCLEVPPMSRMNGVDLITEGTLTLSKTMELLEKGVEIETLDDNAATRLIKLFLDSDMIEFVVGTKINEAHQDPNLPAELDIRRNMIKKMVRILNEKYIKEAKLSLI